MKLVFKLAIILVMALGACDIVILRAQNKELVYEINLAIRELAICEGLRAPRGKIFPDTKDKKNDFSL